MCCHTMTPYPYTSCHLWPKSSILFLCSWAFDTLCWLCPLSVCFDFTSLSILLCLCCLLCFCYHFVQLPFIEDYFNICPFSIYDSTHFLRCVCSYVSVSRQTSGSNKLDPSRTASFCVDLPPSLMAVIVWFVLVSPPSDVETILSPVFGLPSHPSSSASKIRSPLSRPSILFRYLCYIILFSFSSHAFQLCSHWY